MTSTNPIAQSPTIQTPASQDPATQAGVGGSLHVADRVISDLIGYAALECYGIVGMAAPSIQDSVAKLLPARALRRGVTIKSANGGLQVDLYVIIEYGVNLLTVSKNLEDRIRFVIEKYVDLPLAAINVHVQGIHV